MRRNNSIFAGWRVVILAIVVIGGGLTGAAYCQTNSIALLLQQTPADGGTISPDTGVHNFDLNTEVTLTAIPNPGYQFVFWLGDVSDPASSRTVAYLSAPKIIIAVFERVEYDFLAKHEIEKWAGRGGLLGSRADYARGGGGGIGGQRPHKWRWPTPPEPEEEDELPVPEEGDDFPVPIPEPATAVLLVLGGLLTFARRSPN